MRVIPDVREPSLCRLVVREYASGNVGIEANVGHDRHLPEGCIDITVDRRELVCALLPPDVRFALLNLIDANDDEEAWDESVGYPFEVRARIINILAAP